MNRFRGKAFEIWIEEVSENKDYVSPFTEIEYTIVTNNGLIQVVNPELVLETSFNDYSLKCGNANKTFMRFVTDSEEGETIDIPMENITLIKSKFKKTWEFEEGKKYLSIGE